jgi:excisionase family DNA binding protein
VLDNDPGTALLTIPEVARQLRCSQMHVYRLIEHDVLPTVDIAIPGSPSKQRVRADELAEFVREGVRHGD